MAHKVWTGIASLFGIAQGEAEAMGDRPARKAEALRSRLPSKLQEAALDSYKDAIAAGRVHMLDFGAIKTDLKEQWGTIKDRVATSVEVILRQRLTGADMHSRVDDASYLLVLHSRTGEEARMLCGMIALEVKQKLFGEDRDLSEIKISRAAPSMDGNFDLVEINASEAVAQALKSGQFGDQPPPPAAEADPATPAWTPITHKSATKATAELVPVKDAFRSLDVALSSVARSIEVPPIAQPIKKPSAPAPSAEAEAEQARRAAAAQAIEESRRKADEAAAAAAAARQREMPTDVVEAVSFAYQPLWDCRLHAVTSYVLDVRFRVGDTLKSLTEIESWAKRPEILTAIDLLSAKKALADLAQLIGHGHKAIVCVPMHRAVIENSARRTPILNLFSNLPPRAQKLVQIEILDAYAGDWDLLPVLLTTWRRVARDISLRLSLEQMDLLRARSASIKTVGGDLRNYAWSETEAMKKLEAFAVAATRVGVDSYVYGLRSRSEIVCAACAGFRYLSGPAVAKEIETPTGVYALDSVNLYLSSQASADKSA